MLGYLMIANTWTYISLYFRNTRFPVNMSPIGQLEKFFLKFIKFQSHQKKIYWWSSIPVANG